MSTVVESIVTGQAEIARRPLAAERCALVVIDIQQKLLPPIFQKEQLVRNAQLLIRAAEILKIPALISTQYAKGQLEMAFGLVNSCAGGMDDAQYNFKPAGTANSPAKSHVHAITSMDFFLNNIARLAPRFEAIGNHR